LPRLRPLLAGMVLVLLACLGTGATAGAKATAARTPAAGGQPAMPAGAFADSVGVNVSATDADAGWALADRLEAAGIRYVRGPATATPDDPALAGLQALAGAGLGLDLVAGPGADPEAVAEVAASLGAAVAAVEAPAGEAATPLRRAVRGHPDLPGVAVLGSGAGVDYQAVRLELGGRCPGCVADRLGSGDGAVQVTEVDLGTGMPDAVAARYLPRLLLANAGRAVRTYLPGNGGDTGPGLLDAGGSPTAACTAVARLLALLDDGQRPFQPDRLRFRLTGATGDLRHQLFQKGDGHFWLALWVERPGWDPATGQALAVPAQQVTVNLAAPVAGARTFVPERATTAQQHFTDAPGDERVLDAIELQVSDQVQLLELFPRRAGGAAPKATSPPEVPEEPTATTGAPLVVKGSSQPPTPTTRAAGTDTPAAAARPTAALDPASRSPLAFTGSAALSMLGASMLLLLVGVAALFASRRRYHHRH
jgi:hypothetical protein